MMEIQFLPSGDMAITVEFGKEISLDTNKRVRMLHHNLKEHPVNGVIETIPTTDQMSFCLMGLWEL